MKTMISYDSEKKKLTIIKDGKEVGGVIGPMAEAIYKRQMRNIEAATPKASAVMKQQLRVS